MNGSLNFQKTILVCLFILFLFVSGGCVPANQAGNEALAETVVVPSLTASTVPILAEKAAETVINLPTLTPEPTVAVESDINPVDEELAEQIKIAMPSMWFYDHEQQKFVERSNEDFKFSLYKTSKLYITDGNGEEVGFALHFAKNSLDNKSTEYFSLTDKSVNSVIPLRLYSQMDEFTANIGGESTTKQCMYAFVQEYTEFRPNRTYVQEAVDVTIKYAPDVKNIQKGEEMVERAIIKTLSYLTTIEEEKLIEKLVKGEPVEFDTNKGIWVVNKGINYLWSDTREGYYEIKDGELFLFNGFSDSVPDDAIDGCRPMAWDGKFRSFLDEKFYNNFPDVVTIYLVNAQPYLDRYTRQTPVIVDRRWD